MLWIIELAAGGVKADNQQLQLKQSCFSVMTEACLLQVSRITFRNSVTSEEVTKELSKEQESNEVHYKDKETGAELEVIEKLPLLEWLANNYKKFGCQLEFVTNKSQVCIWAPAAWPCGWPVNSHAYNICDVHVQ